MLTILRDIHYANVFMVGTQEDTCEENEVWKFGNSEIKIIFWKYAATTDIRMIIRNVIKTFWIN